MPFGGLNKNEHFVDILPEAKKSGINPDCKCFDICHASLDNLKLIRTGLEDAVGSNRKTCERQIISA